MSVLLCSHDFQHGITKIKANFTLYKLLFTFYFLFLIFSEDQSICCLPYLAPSALSAASKRLTFPQNPSILLITAPGQADLLDVLNNKKKMWLYIFRLITEQPKWGLVELVQGSEAPVLSESPQGFKGSPRE